MFKPTMYLRLHYKHTHEAYRQAKHKYNEQCKKKYPKIEIRTDKKGRTYKWKEYSAHLLKGEHDATFVSLTQAFQVHLDNLIKYQHDYTKPFFTYIKSIATMRDKDESTIWRHFNRLMDAGIITDWSSYGIKNSIKIEIDTNILHADPFDLSGNLRELLVNCYQKNVNNCQYDTENNHISDKDFIFLKRSFTDCYALSIAFCKGFVLNKITKTNINMISGKQPTTNPLLNIASGKQDTLNKIQGRIECTESYRLTDPNNTPQPETQKKGAKDRYGRKIDLFVLLAFNFMMRVLYKNRTFLPTEIKLAKEKIYELFYDVKSYKVRLDDFNEIVMSKSDYNDRKCWVEKPPSVYLNKNNQNGFFRNQKFFYSVTIPQRKNNEKHYSNRRLFAECYRMYTEDQNNYYKIAQLLGKKQKSRDEKIKWRDIFDEKFVINREKLNTQTFFEIDKQHYGR